MKSRLLLFSILLVWTIKGFATSIEVSGTVSGTWSVDTVKVVGNLQILSGETLLIEPGVFVCFQGHYEVFVRGRIVAIGAPADSIRFGVSDTTGFADTTSTLGGWHGFLYQRPPVPNDSSLFAYCIFAYGKAVAPDTTGVYGGVFRIFGWDKLSITRCAFRNNLAYKWGGAIYAKESDILITESAFTGNRCGKATPPYGYGGALCSVLSSPVVTRCTFYNNSSTGIGGGASFEYSDPLLQYNIFDQNTSGLGGGFGYLRTSPQRVASNNLVTNNTAVFFGGGIACIRAFTVFANNTVTGNFASYGGGFYCNDSAAPSNYNCIFYGNLAYEGPEVYIWDVRSAPDFYHCNVAGDTAQFAGSGGHLGYHGTYLDNLDTIPGFTGGPDLPYALARTSPMVDAGSPDTSGLQIPAKDIASGTRIYNDRIDIGAYEWNPGPGIPGLASPAGSISVYPNPASGHVMIRISPELKDPVNIRVFNSSGICVRTLRKISPGDSTFEWNCTSDAGSPLPPGLYILSVEDHQIRISTRLTITR
jgi:predicted outer membrane repeat protein